LQLAHCFRTGCNPTSRSKESQNQPDHHAASVPRQVLLLEILHELHEMIEQDEMRITVVSEQAEQFGGKQRAVQGEQIPPQAAPNRVLLKLRQRRELLSCDAGENDVPSKADFGRFDPFAIALTFPERRAKRVTICEVSE